MRYFLILALLCVNSLMLAEDDVSVNDSGEVGKLELAGADSFEYDTDNKIRKTKSNFQVGVGINFTHNINTEALQVNASVALGYSYFFHKTFGVRVNGIFDNTQTSYFGGVGFDAMLDFIQTEPFGLGVLIGSSFGYSEQYGNYKRGGLIGYFHVGLSMIFDGGRSRIDGITRIPYNAIANKSGLLPEITYVLMYSYTF